MYLTHRRATDKMVSLQTIHLFLFNIFKTVKLASLLLIDSSVL